MRIVIATANRCKLTEIAAILADPCLELAGLADYPPFPPAEETGATFADNALLKAQTAAYHTGGWALADDSGLVIPALDGQPDVLSARFAGPKASDADNVAKVLELMRGMPDDRRQAEFVCSIALVGTNNRAYFSEGGLQGVITREPRGSCGFGYDPVFLLPQLGKTLAEIPAGAKNEISHRTMALRKIKPLLLMLAEREKTAC
jgi:XTP/dITP diphosphohydrolase